MKVVSINLCGRKGSTGKIVDCISSLVIQHGGQAWQAFPPDSGVAFGDYDIRIGTSFFRNFNSKFCVHTGFQDCFSPIATLNLLRRISRIKPDILHLHNLHSCYLNLPMLFRYVKKKGINVVWTLHDCWSFTGQCPYYDMAKCYKWQTGCHDCTQYHMYPGSYVDRTRQMWKLKKKWFTGVKNLTLVTPSAWLAGEAKKSFMGNYQIKVINNGIDLTIYKPETSDFREKHGCIDRFIVLGVAFGWNHRKGLDVFLDLAKRLDSHFQIVLVGTDEKIDKLLPDNIVSIHRTQNQKELAEIYTAADVFANPTREENYPTVNMEALACGTPVITFRTGGSPEIPDDSCGIVVEGNTADAMEKAIRQINEKPFSQEQCLKRAKNFDMNKRFDEYLKLYERLSGKA